MHSRPKRMAMIAGLAFTVLLAIAAYFVPRHVDANANISATRFCDSVTAGEPLESLLGKARASNIDLSPWPPENGAVRYQAWFNGFLGRAYECIITTRDGRVVGAAFEAHTY